MNKQIPLEQRKCRPCEGQGKPLSIEQAKEHLKGLPGWEMLESGKMISKSFIVKNFMTAIDFINKVAAAAEADNHHPDIHLAGYRNLKIDLSTHAVGGLSENDFILAAKIDKLPVELKS